MLILLIFVRNQRQDRTHISRLVAPACIRLLCGRHKAFVSSPQRPYRLWGSPNLFFNTLLPRGWSRTHSIRRLGKKNPYSYSSTVPYIVMACTETTLLYLTSVQVLNKVLIKLIGVISHIIAVLDEVHYSCWRLAPGCIPHC
jgi:hypothetical protein